ncbi:NYN domain-containing protein [Chitinophagaceae bacterium 26-R-25]|nr:NYN domain-containing protein [Chitinophagaceae bacterium 26-R-25]
MSPYPKQRICIYVDGFNFYYGLKSKGWKKYYWLDVVKFFETFIKPYQELIEVTYFSARPLNADQRKRQDLFFSVNGENSKFQLELGRFLPKKIKCNKCGGLHETFEEKETDVKIATKMIQDVVNDKCDITILVSADSDLVPPIEFIRKFKSSHKIFVYFPPERFSSNLNSLANNTKKLGGSSTTFEKCLLADTIKLSDELEVERPLSWR